eukprot:gene4474-4794_t
MTVSITHLPSELCVFVSNFLSFEDWTHFLNAGKSIEHIRRETRYLLLNFELSRRYCTNEDFRNSVNNKVQDRRRQLFLSLDGCSEDSELQHSQGVHRIILNGSSRPSVNGVLHGISDLTFLFCEELVDVSSLSSDSSLKRLQLYMCPSVSIFGAFAHLDTVVICENKEIKSLIPFKDVKIIRLTGCSELRDLSGLTGGPNQQVTLVACQLVEDISPLHSCGKVSINGCHNVTNLLPLLEVPHLSVEYCRGFTDSNQINTFKQRTVKTFHYIPFKDQ